MVAISLLDGRKHYIQTIIIPFVAEPSKQPGSLCSACNFPQIRDTCFRGTLGRLDGWGHVITMSSPPPPHPVTLWGPPREIVKKNSKMLVTQNGFEGQPNRSPCVALYYFLITEEISCAVFSGECSTNTPSFYYPCLGFHSSLRLCCVRLFLLNYWLGFFFFFLKNHVSIATGKFGTFWNTSHQNTWL